MPFSTQEHQNWDDLFAHYNLSYQLVHELNLSGTKNRTPKNDVVFNTERPKLGRFIRPQQTYVPNQLVHKLNLSGTNPQTEHLHARTPAIFELQTAVYRSVDMRTKQFADSVLARLPLAPARHQIDCERPG